MLNANRAHGLWDRTAPRAPETSMLDSGVSVDVTIVGAGYTGLSAALHLAQRGARVAVLEAATIGHGAAGRNSGLINAGMWVLPDEIPARLGPKYGEHLLRVLGEAPQIVFDLIDKHAIPCELERSGTLQCAVGESGREAIRRRAEQWIRRGAAVEILDADETARKVGSSFYCGALFDRRTGTVQPLAYVRGLARAAIAAGAQIYTASPVLGLDQVAPRWRLRTPHGHTVGHWIIVATDTYTKGPWPEVRRELAQLIAGDITESDMPLPRTEPSRARFRSLLSLCYSIGAQAAHFADARI